MKGKTMLRYRHALAYALGIVILSWFTVCSAEELSGEAVADENLRAQQLKQRFASELAHLQELEQHLNARSEKYQAAVEAGQTAEAERLKREYLLLKEEYDASLLKLQKLQRLYKAEEARRRNREIARQLSDDPQADPAAATTAALPGDAEAAQSRKGKGVETVIQEEHALFNRQLTLEAGMTYTHTDRKQLVLNGFLALDAIFLGNIALEGVETDIVRYDLAARYGLTDRLNLNLNIPFIERRTTYQKGGAGGSSAIVGEATVKRNPTLADISFGISYQLWRESINNPDVVWNLSVTKPTGEHPYGVETETHETSDESIELQVPEELPTGSGVWGVSSGLSFVKTLDPAVIFANFSYTYTDEEDFGDIEPTEGEGKQPGEVNIGDTWQYGVGLAYAFNDKLSTSMTFTQSFTETSETRLEGEEWQEIIGSSANSATLGFGVTYAISKNLSMVTNVGSGLTADAPDMNFSIKFPYTF